MRAFSSACSIEKEVDQWRKGGTGTYRLPAMQSELRTYTKHCLPFKDLLEVHSGKEGV